MVTDGEYTPGRIDSYLSLSFHIYIYIYTYVDPYIHIHRHRLPCFVGAQAAQVQQEGRCNCKHKFNPSIPITISKVM